MWIIQKTLSILLAFILLFGTLITPAKAAHDATAVGAVTTGGGQLYVRKTASFTGTVLTSLKKGSYVTLISKSGDWWKVEYAQNQYGYCYAGYITPVEGRPVQVDTGGNVLNVRSGPGTSYSRIATLQQGDTVMPRSTSGTWSRILYHGTKLGYVSSRYLTDVDHAGYASVSLSVPSFKQTDSRWASYPIGSAGGTIGTIGCATTGIAMMESYRTGATIYPDAMAKRLTYTAGGSVYWPGHYKVQTRQSGYLEAIYALLQQGKPVLLGAKKASGGQHWVVITGFVGSSLTPAGFTIHDPGSHSRTNLQQFFNAYPNFYKYFSY